LPWSIVTLNAIVWTIVAQTTGTSLEVENWESTYGIILNFSLAFLLVFRLNRAADRFWQSRAMWGRIVAVSRYLVSTILVHTYHTPQSRDQAVVWIGAFAVSTMHFLRRETSIPCDELAGFLSPDEIQKLQSSLHPPLYASDQIRAALKDSLNVTADTPVSLASAWSQQLYHMEASIDKLIEDVGGMERIRSTPVPIAYVSHLRTFLLAYLLSLPYLWESVWGWATIPAVTLSAYALLGIEGASDECGVPFDKTRTNHLAMDSFCLLLLANIQQFVQQAADRELLLKQSEMGVGTVQSKEKLAEGENSKGGMHGQVGR
jgi:putative membrane protein